MDKQIQFPEPGLDGPDYVALVIDWDELAEIEDEAAEATTLIERPQPRFHRLRLVAATLGALGVIGLAAWGVHRIRTA